jgi:hypothetical protein
MPLHQRRDVTVFCATTEIAFPMTGDGAVLDFCGSFPDGDGIYDLTARVFKDTRVLRAADAALGSQVLEAAKKRWAKIKAEAKKAVTK